MLQSSYRDSRRLQTNLENTQEKRMRVYRNILPLALAALVLPAASMLPAQSPAGKPTPIAASAPTAVPALVPFSGVALSRSGAPMSAETAVTFLIFRDEQGGEPLWAETQPVAVDPAGHYMVQLGAANPSGLPTDLFSTGEARWLEVQVAGEKPEPRILLASVPYALKAGDATTLGGLPVSAFALVEKGAFGVAAPPDDSPDSSSTSVTTTGGKAGYIPEFSGASAIVDSPLFIGAGGEVGVGTATPATTLDVQGTATLRGNTFMPPSASATATSGVASPKFEWSASSFKNGASAIAQTFAFQAIPEGNNTTAPSADLYLFFGSGGASPQSTGMSFLPSGIINFAAGQKFPGTGAGTITGVNPGTGLTGGGTSGAVTLNVDPRTVPLLGIANTFTAPITFAPGQTFPGTGAGTITGITTTAPLMGGGTAGALTLGLNTTTLEGTLNAVYAQLDTANNFFNGNAQFGGAVSSNADNESGSGGIAISGTGSSGATGVYGKTDTGAAVKGWATGDGNAGYFTSDSQIYSTLYATNQASAAGEGYPNAFTGTTTGNGTIAVTGSTAGNNSTSVYGEAGGNGSVGVSGVATGGKDTSNELSIGVYGQATQGIGILGVTATVSSVFSRFAGFAFTPGVWGDGGPDGNSGIVGTADEGTAGDFENNSIAIPTLHVHNESTAGTGLFKTLIATSPTGTCGIGGGGDLSCTGQLKSLVSTAGGAHKVETYAMQSPENWMEDFGSGNLLRGVATVRIDPAFAETVSESAEYHVFLTPKGDSKGLYVIDETAAGFEVRESGGGTSSLSFDYRIVAKRRGYEAQRLTDVSESFKAAFEPADRDRGISGSQRPGGARPAPIPSGQRVPPALQTPIPHGSSAVLQHTSSHDEPTRPQDARTSR
jgi:hypothetical protein